MLLFGGIFEITRELNDAYIYSLKDNSWHNLYEESGPSSPIKVKNEESPLRRKATSTNAMENGKPQTNESNRKVPKDKKKGEEAKVKLEVSVKKEVK